MITDTTAQKRTSSAFGRRQRIANGEPEPTTTVPAVLIEGTVTDSTYDRLAGTYVLTVDGDTDNRIWCTLAVRPTAGQTVRVTAIHRTSDLWMPHTGIEVL